MQAIEFRTTVHDGIIEIPEEFRGAVSGLVNVRMEPAASEQQTANAINDLIARPLQRPGFRPLSREEAHAR